MLNALLKFPAPHFAALLSFLLISGCPSAVQGGTPGGGTKVIRLPAPDKEGTVPLETTLQKRRSVRSFQNVSLSLQAVSQLLWAAQGLSGRHGLRTAPSAGALYPLDMYVAAGNVDGLATGIYRYDPAEHALVLIKAGNHLDVLSRAALGQAAISLAPVSFVITGKERRTTGKYGARGVRYMLMESGHAAQNLCLQAVALGLDSVTIGAFSDRETAAILAVEKGATPLYIIPVGKGARN